MDNRDFFWWLVSYHLYSNVQESLIKAPRGTSALEGVITGSNGMPLPEGEESRYYQGLLFLVNGVDNLKKLIKKGWVSEEDEEYEGFTYLRGVDDFFAYLKREIEEREGEGTAYVFNAEGRVIMNVPEFKNSPEKSFYRALKEGVLHFFGKKSQNLVYALPEDFIALYANVPVTSRALGTKTRLSIRHTRANPEVEAFQIKRTVKGSYGMGPVTWFDTYGLREEFILDYQPGSSGPFVDEAKKIVGIYRVYRNSRGEPVYNARGRLIPAFERLVVSEEIPRQKMLENDYGRVA